MEYLHIEYKKHLDFALIEIFKIVVFMDIKPNFQLIFADAMYKYYKKIKILILISALYFHTKRKRFHS